MPSAVGTYYKLAKPGIIYGNIVTALAGYFFAAGLDVDFGSFIFMLLGLSAVIGSACVWNNLLDLRIDSVMKRTRRRPLVTGEISARAASVYASALLIVGIMLTFLSSPIVAITSIFGFICYVFLYGYAKRKTPIATEIGSISGAVPIVVGYVAYSGVYDLVALVLFSIMVLWQMPHFYSIALFSKEDYAAAKIPVISLKVKLSTIQTLTFIYICLFSVSIIALYLVAQTSVTFLVVMMIASAGWIYLGIKSVMTQNQLSITRLQFRYSLILLIIFCLLLSFDVLLP